MPNFSGTITNTSKHSDPRKYGKGYDQIDWSDDGDNGKPFMILHVNGKEYLDFKDIQNRKCSCGRKMTYEEKTESSHSRKRNFILYCKPCGFQIPVSER